MALVSKSTINYAERREIQVKPVECKGLNVVLICRNNQPLFTLFSNTDGSYSWKSNAGLPQNIKEELPATYRDEESLRFMIDYVAKELAQ